jgi:hypothetical protein
MSDDDFLDVDDEQLLKLPRPPCPACGGRHLVRESTGCRPWDDPLVARAERGEVDIEFAGCVISEGPLPMWRCRSCDALVDGDGSPVDEAW